MKHRALIKPLEELRDLPIRIGDLYVPAKMYIAIQIYCIVIYGIMPGPNGVGIPVGERERLNLLKWLYFITEGSPPSLPHADTLNRMPEELSDEDLADIIYGRR